MNSHPSTINYTARIIALGLLGILLLCALARSHAQIVNTVTPSSAGVYALMSVDGKNVPCAVNHNGTIMNVQAGTFTITTNRSITSVMTVSVGDKKNVRIERHGDYTVQNSELAMKWQNAGITKGRLTDQSLTMTSEGTAYCYRK